MPVLSRLYSPDDFSQLAVFSGILSVISVAVCLRFDIAVTLPDNDTDAANILALALSSAIAITLLISVPCLLMAQKVSVLINQPSMKTYLWLILPGMLLSASYSTFQNWFVRHRQFGLISTSRIGQSLGAVGVQVGMGFVGVGPPGLLIGYIMNSGIACIVFGCNLLHSKDKVWKTISIPRMRAMAVAHQRFPKYSSLEALANSGAIHVPIIIIAALAVGPEAGYLTMGMYVLQAPVALIGTAIAQVYLSRAPDEYRSGQLGEFTVEIFGKLLKIGAGPLLFAGIVSPVALPIVLGNEWVRAGQLVAWMTPWFIMQFIAYPISMALHVTGRQRTAFMLQLFALVARLGVVWVAGSFATNKIAEAYAISGFAIYSVYSAAVLHSVAIRRSKLTRCFWASLPHIAAWTALGLITKIGIDTITKALI
jgi:O-antigen/teichoic acid export membrane protein